jgi:C1A family cysteine protease
MKNIIATLAIAGTAATLALLNMNSAPVHQNFLATPFTEAEREFIDFIAKHKRTYATKEEYEYRLSVFSQNFEDI